MSILIKNATIIFPGHEFNNTKKDILIKNGVIEKISNRISAARAKKIESKQLHVSPGWMDIGTTCGEPGYEHRETLLSINEAASAGGFTSLALFPNTFPVVDNGMSVQYVHNRTSDLLVSFHPIGAISKGCEGKEITEMIDMDRHGAVAFSDGHKSIISSGLMMRAMDYIKGINSILIHHPSDPTLANDNQINEGLVSTELGIKGNPNLSELLTLDRDLELARYTASSLLVHNVSTAESISRLSSLKKEKIYASVSYLNLCKTENELRTFDPNYKTIPPLRTDIDREALIQGVTKKNIQVITSNHYPLEEEKKKMEYVYATPGVTGLQTCWPALNTYVKNLSLSKTVECLSINPRKILNLDPVVIKTGARAELTLFDPSISWKMDAKTNKSKSKNSPFWDENLNGGVIGVVNGTKSYFNKF